MVHIVNNQSLCVYRENNPKLLIVVIINQLINIRKDSINVINIIKYYTDYPGLSLS